MAAGSRKKFSLDLNDIIAFPDAKHMPVYPPEEQESWIILLEVIHPSAVNNKCAFLTYHFIAPS
jgi:hypothetical protein